MGTKIPVRPRVRASANDLEISCMEKTQNLNLKSRSDLPTIDGIGEHAVLMIAPEIRTNVDAFPAKTHRRWLSFCPELIKSGGDKQKKGKSLTHASSNRITGVRRVCWPTAFRPTVPSQTRSHDSGKTETTIDACRGLGEALDLTHSIL